MSLLRLLNPALNARHVIVPNDMIPRPKIPRRVLHKAWKESRWVRSQESLVRPFSSVAQTEELSKPLHVMRFPPNLPVLNRPLVRGNSVTAYSDNANRFVNIPKIWLRYGRPSNIWYHMFIREGIIASAAVVSTKLPNSVSLTHFRCFQLLLVFLSS